MLNERNCVSVSELNAIIKATLEEDEGLSSIFLRGEVSNFKVYSSGHAYFSLKDSQSVISAVMWASYASRLTFLPKDGDEVLVHGRIGVYPARGSYQIIVDHMELFGKGAELLRLQELKEKLAKEGLFDQSRKRKIPAFPHRIGVIAGASSAGLRDILVNIENRWPLVEVIVFPSLVQGKDAPQALLRALNEAKGHFIDTLIIGRGGGSSEDLGAFNDETLVRAAAEFPCPVIAAVGHEVDVTLIDLVADLRVSTPTGAAVAATPDKNEVIQTLDGVSEHLDIMIDGKIRGLSQTLSLLSKRSYFENPAAIYDKKLDDLSKISKNLDMLIDMKIAAADHSLESSKGRLAALNPYAVLKRGYAISEDEDGKVVQSAKQVAVGTIMKTRFNDGIITSRVEKKEASNNGQ
ncbi:MAG: exodeoxyribonuclease VII large subunit [Bacilli bacterium]|nr:exodeoxyribonuclease VII large subunit [Bacilli bacterium]